MSGDRTAADWQERVVVISYSELLARNHASRGSAGAKRASPSGMIAGPPELHRALHTD
jgi:hypothetical protein